jgi:hypothetical protein
MRKMIEMRLKRSVFLTMALPPRVGGSAIVRNPG